jgi:hypothetical protein
VYSFRLQSRREVGKNAAFAFLGAGFHGLTLCKGYHFRVNSYRDKYGDIVSESFCTLYGAFEQATMDNLESQGFFRIIYDESVFTVVDDIIFSSTGTSNSGDITNVCVRALNVNYCKNCTAGTYSASGASACTACAGGKYQAEPGQAACIHCGLGTYSYSDGATTCEVTVPRLTCSECSQSTCLNLPGLALGLAVCCLRTCARAVTSRPRTLLRFSAGSAVQPTTIPVSARY